MSRILLATRNAKKLAELQRILGDSVKVLGLSDVREFPEEPETGATFEANAVDKAVQAARETGEISLADDSGFCVDALNSMPGVLSARWAGHHGDDDANKQLVLAQLTDTPDERRGAEFVCALALAVPGEEPRVVRGQWRGVVIREERGSNGFGYDPIFVPEGGDGRSSAELTPAEKDAQSHRGLATALMLPQLKAALGLI
ncbi:RdgB/HAM1 family non-canonical purine NTP pyrophosphatase [Nakamurella antarctica]|uniref:dITP/XTP pyrophosphatase n=1 Tax=Nakamurella antarctica TaxID=1902245 RepID=A0A3G8ZXG1_9ACTN|nr:RdgB/HAM1 family non-canonical purine NTP pyrophosphatase [Nakamurella antarctica]AZI58341.1 RdgB/HAM1 family non-canonical purine NTP pyrophosphatase [Nakamurella antarctica]